MARLALHYRFRPHTVIPGEERKVDRLATICFLSTRYSVPHRLEA